MLNKRGLQQADWAISFGIFTLFLVVFFIAVKPLLMPPSKADSILDMLEDEFVDNVTRNVNRVPIILGQSSDYDFEPVIISLPYDWNSSNVVVSEGYFVLDGNRLMFHANTSRTNNFSVSHTTDNQDVDAELRLISSAISSELEGFKVIFVKGVQSSYTYTGRKRIQSLIVSVDNRSLNSSYTYEDFESLAKYSVQDAVNHTTYVFAKNPRTYTFIKPTDRSKHAIKLSIELDNYTEYYSDVSNYGDIIYTIDKCREMTASFIDFSNVASGVAFFFSKKADLELCSNQTGDLSMDVELEINSSEEMSYNIFMHQGDHKNVEDYPIDPILGFQQNIESISLSSVSDLATSNYTRIKALWGIPQEHDFRIVFKSGPYNVTFGPAAPMVDVYAKTLKGFNYDGVGFENVEAVLNMWGGS